MSRIATMIALILAGEMVFGLPFHTARFFRPTLLEVFNFSNTELGDAFAVFGIAALLSYFPGGSLADRFSPRKLMCLSLFATAAGGVFMATIPGFQGMALLYGFWGVTTAFFLWGALIKATREWGGERTQGAAFGVLEGGRGLAAVIVSQLAVFLFVYLLPGDSVNFDDAERRAAFQGVILLYTALTALFGVFVWFAIPESPSSAASRGQPLLGMRVVLGRPIVWAQAIVIFCAYCGYKGSDNYTLYAVQVLGLGEAEASQLFTNISWSRPVAALLAGLIADRFIASRAILVMFAVLAVAYATWSSIGSSSAGAFLIYVNMTVTLVLVFALRGVYFAMLQENQTPKYYTGAAVGLISLLGFMPDFVFAPIAGRILDADPGLLGHQHLLMLLAGIAALGVVAVLCLIGLQRQGVAKMWPNNASSKETTA